jgi:hypothetical protein
MQDQSDNCSHFLTAIQEGTWARFIGPPVFCDSFRFEEGPLVQALAGLPNVVNYIKPRTGRHTRIRAYYCADPDLVKTLKEQYRRVPTTGARCVECNNDTAVVDEIFGKSRIICYLCGSSAALRS